MIYGFIEEKSRIISIQFWPQVGLRARYTQLWVLKTPPQTLIGFIDEYHSNQLKLVPQIIFWLTVKMTTNKVLCIPGWSQHM